MFTLTVVTPELCVQSAVTESGPSVPCGRGSVSRDPRHLFLVPIDASAGKHTAPRLMKTRPPQRLVDAGNTVLVIEHNLDVIKQADWIVDLGPEGGDAGGELIAAGTPEEVADVDESYTGRFLREVLPARAVAAA